MNTQLVKYLVVSILHVQVFLSAILPTFAQTSYSNTTAHYSSAVDDIVGTLTEDCPHTTTENLWHFNESDITPDNNIRWGAIQKNRMRYAIQKRPGPPSIRLLIDAGLVTEESEEQEGICDLLVKYFTFVNKEAPFSVSANTDFNGSVYAIDLTIENEALLDQALETLASHFRGAILEERNLDALKATLLNTYEIPPPSIDDQRRTFIFSNSQLARKNTIKDLTPNREVLENFIQHWHSPDRAVLFIAGDVSTNEIALKIDHYFSALQAPAITHSTPAILNPEHLDMDAHAILDPSADFAHILLETILYKSDNKDSKKARKQALLHEIEETLMLKRLLEVSSKTDEVENACVRFYDHLNTLNIRKINITTSPENWEKAVEIVVEQLVNIVYKDGFSEEEFDHARQYVENKHRNFYENIENTNNQTIADAFIERVKKGQVPSNPKDDYSFTKNTLKEISVSECNEALYQIWQTQQCYLIAEGNIGIDSEDEALDALTQTYLESAFSAVRRHRETLDIPDRFTLAPPKKSYPISKTSTYEHLGLAQIRYENNFFFNIANSHSDTEYVHMTVRFGMGKLAENLRKPGLGYLVEHIFLESGLARFDSKSIQALENALGIELTFEMKEDAFLLRGKCPPQYTGTLLQLLFAYVTEPKLSPKALELAKKSYIEDYYRHLESPEGFIKLNGGYHLFTPENVFKAPTPEIVSERTLKELKEWIGPVIKESVFELSIVGSFEANDFTYITDTLDKTFATLSPRKPDADTSLNIQSIEIRPNNKKQSYTHRGDQELWGARIAWPTCDGWSKLETRKLSIITEILKKRVHRALNLAFGTQYSNKIENLNSLTYHNLGCIQSTVLNTLENADETKAIILDEAEKLAKASELTFEQFTKTIKPMIDAFKTFSPRTTGLREKEDIRAHIKEKMQKIAEEAMGLVNTNGTTYEELRAIMMRQVSNMKRAAHYHAVLLQEASFQDTDQQRSNPLPQKDFLEDNLHQLKSSLLDLISSLNPNDLTVQEVENITRPTIDSLIGLKTKILKIQGLQAQSNLKEWFLEKTELVLSTLQSLAEENGRAQNKPPEILASKLNTLLDASLRLPPDGDPNFNEALNQAQNIQELIDLINENAADVYGDVSPALIPHKNAFLQITQNLKFQKNTVKQYKKTIERKFKTLVDNAWELNPNLPSRDAVEATLKPLVEEILETAYALQEHLELDELLDRAIDRTLHDAWNTLNPYHITPRELQEATKKLELYLQTKANTPNYWMDNVLIGSQFYPQKLDWAPHLISDYLETDIEEINHTVSKYLHKSHAYIVEVLPQN